jgi:hypothetical protein
VITSLRFDAFDTRSSSRYTGQKGVVMSTSASASSASVVTSSWPRSERKSCRPRAWSALAGTSPSTASDGG